MLNFFKKRELFFGPKFHVDLDWGEQKLSVGSVSTLNKDQIARSIKDLSTESIRNRFLGSKKEFSAEELEYLTQLDGWNHYAIGIEEREDSKRGIAIVRLVRSAQDPLEAEIAITIIDEYQHKGLGTFLIRLIALATLERKIERLSFTFLPQNEGIIKLIRKIGTSRKGITKDQMDYVQLFLDTNTIVKNDQKKALLRWIPDLKSF